MRYKLCGRDPLLYPQEGQFLNGNISLPYGGKLAIEFAPPGGWLVFSVSECGDVELLTHEPDLEDRP
jgi:hypothetical protein